MQWLSNVIFRLEELAAGHINDDSAAYVTATRCQMCLGSIGNRLIVDIPIIGILILFCDRLSQHLKSRDSVRWCYTGSHLRSMMQTSSGLYFQASQLSCLALLRGGPVRSGLRHDVARAVPTIRSVRQLKNKGGHDTAVRHPRLSPALLPQFCCSIVQASTTFVSFFDSPIINRPMTPVPKWAHQQPVKDLLV